MSALCNTADQPRMPSGFTHRAGRRAGHVWLSHLATRLVRQTDEPIRQISDEEGAVFGRLHDIYRIAQDRGGAMKYLRKGGVLIA
jgi:hypothetical protein